jgi:hypothetical protein
MLYWIDVQHYNNGVAAYHAGVKLLDCPFMNNPYTRDAMIHWYEGWTDEEIEHLRQIDSDNFEEF